jgi:hypothetical protein
MYEFPYFPCRISLCENTKRIFEWSALKMSYIKIIIDEKCIAHDKKYQGESKTNIGSKD